MALESATFVSGLVQANPPGTDVISQGDDHLRLIKKVLLNSFPNADAAINGIHVKATAPSSTTAGLLWFDSTDNILKLRDETNNSWIALAISPVTDYKILGSPTVGWTLPTAEGTSGQALTTNAAGALVFANAGDVRNVSHGTQSISATIREETYTDTGYTFTYTKQEAATDLYIQCNFECTNWSNFDTVTTQTQTVRLVYSTSTVITPTDIRVGYMTDDTQSGTGNVEHGNVASFVWKASSLAAASYTFKIQCKSLEKDDGGFGCGNAAWLIWEVV
tara:strand:- start:3028 stop:3858 length:831 start_codon:yes stop_codon:yes gene_type:complete